MPRYNPQREVYIPPLSMLIGAAVFGGGGVVIVPLLLDNFVDVNGTLLTAHTMDIGPGWSLGDGSWDIQSNHARYESTNVLNGTAVSDPGTGVVTITVEGQVSDAASNAFYGLCARWQDHLNFINFRFHDGDGAAYLTKVVAGTPTVLGSAAITSPPGDKRRFVLSIDGSNNLTCTMTDLSNNNTANFSVNDTTFAGNTKCGLFAYTNGADLVTKDDFSLFKVTSP